MRKILSLRRLLLAPLIPLYRLALGWREVQLTSGLESVRRLQFPVISIGNLSTGGSGKTPLTIALARALTKRGLRVDVLTRGYGRQSTVAERVNPAGTAEEYGDEPILIALAARVPVYVAPQRFEAGQLAENDARAEAVEKAAEKAAEKTPDEPEEAPTPPPPPVHLLDDGFQHRQLDRKVNILMLNTADWRDWLLPAGNLREPVEAIRRASVIAVPAIEPELESALCVWGWEGPVWRLHRTMEIPVVQSPVAAFCGIARPEQFFHGLEDVGLKLAIRLAFPDHFTYTREVLEELIEEAKEMDVKAILTTDKDLVRLGKLATIFPKNLPPQPVSLRISIEDADAALDWLIDQVTNAPAKG